VNFIAIQNSHSVACAGYHQYTVRTGYDAVVADRTYDLFAHTAKKAGTVKHVGKKGIIVEYEDGEVLGYEIGRRYGESVGLVIPHNVVTPLKSGDVFKVGDVIVYNDGFFEPDFFDKTKVTLKNTLNVKTVLWESTQTLEDASSVSRRLTNKLATKITKKKEIVIGFDQSIYNLVSVGDVVDYDSVLCIVEDAVTANNNLFNEASIDTLKSISAQTPRAKAKGIVERIDIFYHGEIEDMSDSLRKIAENGDKELASRLRAINKPVITGVVDESLRIDNTPLGLDNLVIRIYITTDVNINVGDKAVFANQAKTVFSEVLEKDYVTEDGIVIDAIFGGQSINDRIISSPYIIGMHNELLEVITNNAVELYFN
jgi:signal peptidase I